AGTHVMQHLRPMRQPSVLRQTILTRARNEFDAKIGPADAARIGPMWELLKTCERAGGHVEITRALHLLRRVHDRDFLSNTTRASLLFALVESLVGRFRAPDDPVPLHLLVARALGDPGHPAARWFEAEARDLRNAMAHGRVDALDDPAPLEHLLAIARAALTLAIRTWIENGQPQARPAKLLIRKLSTG
ncbi:MAG: hypothetical protein ACREVR_11460, partial [Burkholderiales bacterium]